MLLNLEGVPIFAVLHVKLLHYHFSLGSGWSNIYTLVNIHGSPLFVKSESKHLQILMIKNDHSRTWRYSVKRSDITGNRFQLKVI